MTMNRCLQIILWCIFYFPLICTLQRPPEENFTGDLTLVNGSTYARLAFTTQRYTVITWKYDFKVRNYRYDDNHPYVFFYNEEQSHVYISNYWTRYGCIGNTETFVQYDIRDRRLVHLERTWRSPCYLDSRTSTLSCSGEIKVAAAYPVRYIASLAYRCPYGSRPPHSPAMSVSYDVTIEPYESVTCLPTANALSAFHLNDNIKPFVEKFRSYYSNYSLWNLLGVSEYDIKEQADYFQLLTGFTCYKYLYELLFRVALPQCINGKVIYQCEEMCEDFRTACDDAGSALLAYSLGCANLASMHSEHACYYRTVTCDATLDPPAHGHVSAPNDTTVHSKRTFTCDEGYELIGNNTAVCGYSGNWEIDEIPKCRQIQVQVQKQPIIVIIVLSVVGGLLIFILALSFYIYGRYRHEVFILIVKYFRCFLCCSRFHKTEEGKQYDAFVAYHDDDENFVKDMQVKLEASGYKLFVDYRDGRLGEPPIRYIPDAIVQSQRVILILSESFLDDRMCEFMLDQAFYQTLEGESFQVIIVLMEEPKTMAKKIPRFLKGFMRTGACVNKNEQLFCTKIKHAMPVKKVESMGIHPENPEVALDFEQIHIDHVHI